MTNRRLLHEINRLMKEQGSRPLLQNDYLVELDEYDTTKVHTIIKAPYDSVYRHTFLRLDFKIPDDYPHSPPEVTLVNHDSVRIHPNMYEDGKCCSTILNTWPSDNEKWTSSMGIETILLAFMSFLDYNPYTHEPGGRDDPTYTIYVRYQSFKTLLLRYIQYENISTFLQYISDYVSLNKESLLEDLRTLAWEYPADYYYTPCFEIDRYYLDYPQVKHLLCAYFYFLPDSETIGPSDDTDDTDVTREDTDVTREDTDVNCSDTNCLICFESSNTPGAFGEGSSTSGEGRHLIKLECLHDFHEDCLENHILKNGEICPICRQSSTEWVINPITKRRLKRKSRTYNRIYKIKET
jgi:ubiquitin-protein ligase